MEGNRVYLAACPDYGQAEAKLREAVAALGGMERFVRPGERILLKANLLRAAPPESAICTHPAVAAAAAKLVAEAGGTAVITDSPGGALHKEAVLRGLYEKTGMAQAAAASGAELCYDASTRTVSLPAGRVLKQAEVIAPVAEADGVFDLPKLKTHVLMSMTGAVKNLFGVLPEPRLGQLPLPAARREFVEQREGHPARLVERMHHQPPAPPHAVEGAAQDPVGAAPEQFDRPFDQGVDVVKGVNDGRGDMTPHLPPLGAAPAQPRKTDFAAALPRGGHLHEDAAARLELHRATRRLQQRQQQRAGAQVAVVERVVAEAKLLELLARERHPQAARAELLILHRTFPPHYLMFFAIF